MARNQKQRKGREERPERNPEVTSLTAEVVIEGGFVAELKASQDKRSGEVKEHVQLTFIDMSGKDRSYLMLHDYREATLAVVLKSFKLGEGGQMTEEQEKQLLAAMNQPAHVSIREGKGGFDYVVLKPAWVKPLGRFMAYEQLPNQPLRESKERTLWIWRTGFPKWSLTVLKLVEVG